MRNSRMAREAKGSRARAEGCGRDVARAGWRWEQARLACSGRKENAPAVAVADLRADAGGCVPLASRRFHDIVPAATMDTSRCKRTVGI